VKIRATTYFVELTAAAPDGPLDRAAVFLQAAETVFREAGITVQSRRAATQPFPRMGASPDDMPGLAAYLRAAADSRGIAYVSIGPVGAADDPAYADMLPDILRAAPGIFASLGIANRADGINLGLLRRAARVIQRVSRVAPDGWTNLYLAASANVKPGAPFFPAAYHGGGPDRFALAIEAADLALEAFQGAATPDEARQRLTGAIKAAADRLVGLAETLARNHGIAFDGLDFSLAPYPGAATSLAGAMEQLGVTAGGGGMVAAASLVMNAIEAAQFPRCGFSGLMLPVLEDTILGTRAAEGALRINDLLLYSAICGTGLDCIPLPGDVSEAALTGILLDTAALALRLDKPLTARLMPLPGKSAGDPVTFDFEYFVPSRVMAPLSGLSAGAFGGEGTFKIVPRR
jgi:uncharacterized protein (UPF0210 family)